MTVEQFGQLLGPDNNRKFYIQGKPEQELDLKEKLSVYELPKDGTAWIELVQGAEDVQGEEGKVAISPFDIDSAPAEECFMVSTCIVSEPTAAKPAEEIVETPAETPAGTETEDAVAKEDVVATEETTTTEEIERETKEDTLVEGEPPIEDTVT